MGFGYLGLSRLGLAPSEGGGSTPAPSATATLLDQIASQTNGLAFDASSMEILVRDSGTPANSYDGDANSWAGQINTSPPTVYRFNSSGILVSGTDWLCNHNPGNSNAVLGLGMEPAATNTVTYSRDVSNLTLIGLTGTANAATGLDGTSYMDKIAITDTSSTDHTLRDTSLNGSYSTFTNYLCSCVVEDIDQRYVGIRLYGANNHWAHATFDLTGQSVTTQTGSSSGTVADSGIEDLGGGRYRIWAAMRVSSVTAVSQFGVMFDNAATPTLDSASGNCTYSGTAGVGLYIGDYQIETGIYPTSIIPTSAGSATRAKTQYGADLSVAPVSTTAATVVVIGRLYSNVAGARILTLGDGVTDRATIKGNASSTIYCTGNAVDLSLSSYTEGDEFRIAYAIDGSGQRACLNGGTVQSGGAGALTGLDKIVFGMDANAGNHGIVEIRKAAWVPHNDFSNAELQSWGNGL